MKQSRLTELISQMAVLNSESAYRELFDLLFNPLSRFSYNIVKSWEVAEEVASDVLFILWQKRERLVDVENIKYYAFVAARNNALNVVKSQTGNQMISLSDIDVDIQLDTASPEVIFIQGELKEKMETAISSLPKQCKLVFTLVKEEGFSYKETAEMLGVSPKTVDAHLVNAMKKLTVILKNDFKLA